jgi:inward rectifier potassium channel
MRQPHRQRFSGRGFETIKIGVPSRLSDLYYQTMEMSWPAFILAVALVYLFVNLVFGALYASVPGAVDNARPNSLLDGFFFSVDTLGTVGYGSMAPKSPIGHLIAAFEILVGLFFSATITGLIFARFSRPRSSLIFSKLAVIGRYEEQPALMVRVASTRSRPLADASAQMSWLERKDEPGGRLVRRMIDLPLVRSHNPALGVSWTLVHLLADDSDFLAALQAYERFTLNVSVTGIDTLLASPAISGFTYRKHEILIGHEYCDVLSEHDDVVMLDLTKFDEVRSLS